MAEYRLEMRGVSKSFPGVKALDGINLKVRPGTVHALMGENGAGKSTLMKCLFGIYHMDEGEVYLDGEKITSFNDLLFAGYSVSTPIPLTSQRPGGEMVQGWVIPPVDYEKGRSYPGILNIILDPIFILPWGLGMGAAGAGLATFLSNCVACLYFFILLYAKRGHTFVCINPKKFRLKRNIIIGVCGVGIPASIQNLLNVTGMTILNNFTAVHGADAVAAMGIAYKLYMVQVATRV